MRAVIGLAFGLGLYTLAGWALLFALGLIATIRDALWATGLALLSGIALVGVTLVALLVIGLDVTLPVFVGVALLWSAALATAGSLAGGRASRRTPLTVPPLSRYERWIAWSVGVALTFFVLLEAVLSRNLPIGHDASHFWTPEVRRALRPRPPRSECLQQRRLRDGGRPRSGSPSSCPRCSVPPATTTSSPCRCCCSYWPEPESPRPGSCCAGRRNVLWAFALVPLVPLVFAEAFSRTRTHARRLRRRRRPGRGALGA